MKRNDLDNRLVARIKEGDNVAFYNIYERYCKRLYGFVLRYIKTEADADEIVQIVFVRIWENRNKINTYSSFESFLFTIAYNETISLLRKKAVEKKYLEHLKSLQDKQKARDFVDEIHFKFLNDKVKELAKGLTPRQQEIFRLSREEGLCYADIAAKLNISPNTVKKHMANILSYLKKHIDMSLISSVFFLFLFVP